MQILKLSKLCEETVNEIVAIDPQNAEFKFYQTKLLIENSRDIWISQLEYLRARSIIEFELSKYPEDYDLNKYLGELEQISYSIKIKVAEQKIGQLNYLQIGGDNINGTCGNNSTEPTNDCYFGLDELYSK